MKRWVLLLAVLAGCTETADPSAAAGSIATVPDDALTETTELGPVTATVSAFPPAPTIGDEVFVVLEVTAKDGVVVTMPAFGEALGRFAMVGFAEDTTTAEASTRHVQRYTLQATRSGPTRIPRLRIELADMRAGHEEQRVRELLTEPLSIRVAPILDPGKLGELPAPMAALSRKSDGGSNLWLYGGLLTAAAMLLALAGWLWRRGGRNHKASFSAHEIALARLTDLERGGVPETADAAAAFYVDLADIVRRYLDGRFGLRAPERTTEELCAEAQTRPDLAAPHRRLIAEFLARCDRVKFASANASSDESRAALAAARRLVEETVPTAEEARA